MGTPTSAGQPGPGGVFRADLATDPASARQARVSVRQALASWGMDDPSGDAELLASELVANAAEHTGSQQIGFVLRRHTGRDGQRGVTCEVTDTPPAMPAYRTTPDAERGRGLAIVAPLASSSGVRPETSGKTSWFTLALTDRAHQAARPIEHEPEAGA